MGGETRGRRPLTNDYPDRGAATSDPDGDPASMLAAVGMSDRVGQATTIEQSRAIAQVQAAVVMARQFPRNPVAARRRLTDQLSAKYTDDKWFYRFDRGGTLVTGPTVRLVEEMAKAWGNMDWGFIELDRQTGRSELMAVAWDLEANVRRWTTFIVPHQRDRKGGKVDDLTSTRDIYDNNANMAGRRLRTTMLAVIPRSFSAEAEDIARITIGRKGGDTHEERVAAVLDIFERWDVDQGRIETKLGRTADKWSVYDLASLRTIHGSIQRGEVVVDDEFPDRRITYADLGAGTTTATDDAPAADPAGAGGAADPSGPVPDPAVPDSAAGSGPPSDDPPEPVEELTAPEVRRRLKAAKLTVSKALKAVQEAHPDDDLATLDAVLDSPDATATLLDWIDGA